MSFKIEKDWQTKAGHRALVAWVNDSHRCGYVAVKQESSLAGKTYKFHLDKENWNELLSREGIFKGSPIDILIASHDRENGCGPQLSYFVNVHGGITFSGELKDASPGWFFGFDCAHSGDKTSYSKDGEERTLGYCEGECESLSAQLSAIENGRKP